MLSGGEAGVAAEVRGIGVQFQDVFAGQHFDWIIGV